MGFKVIEEQLNGLVVFEPEVFKDERGYFFESFREDFFSEMGIKFIQENQSLSQNDVIRGLHFQWDKPQGKLIRVVSGAAKFVELDIRKNSPTLGQYFTIELNEENNKMLWVPPGFANGFLSLFDNTIVQYKCTEYWNPNGESAINVFDPALNINWGVGSPIISEKDKYAISLENWLNSDYSNIF